MTLSVFLLIAVLVGIWLKPKKWIKIVMTVFVGISLMFMFVGIAHKIDKEKLVNESEILFSNTVSELEEAKVCYDEANYLEITECILDSYLYTTSQVQRYIEKMDIIIK